LKNIKAWYIYPFIVHVCAYSVSNNECTHVGVYTCTSLQTVRQNDVHE